MRILIVIVFFNVCFAQEAEESRVAQLEKKVAAIQDFLSLELQNLKNDLKQQSQRSEILRKRNNFLLKKVKFLESKVKDLEAQILSNKIQSIQRNAASATQEGSTNDGVVDDVATEEETFQDPKVQALVTEIASSNPDIRMGAVIQLGSIQGEEATQLLKKAFTDSNPYVKVLACKIALQKNDETIAEDLLSLLSDDNTEVRKHANLALEAITNTKVGFEYNGTKTTRDEKILEWKNKIK